MLTNALINKITEGTVYERGSKAGACIAENDSEEPFPRPMRFGGLLFLVTLRES